VNFGFTKTSVHSWTHWYNPRRDLPNVIRVIKKHEAFWITMKKLSLHSCVRKAHKTTPKCPFWRSSQNHKPGRLNRLERRAPRSRPRHSPESVKADWPKPLKESVDSFLVLERHHIFHRTMIPSEYESRPFGQRHFVNLWFTIAVKQNFTTCQELTPD